MVRFFSRPRRTGQLYLQGWHKTVMGMETNGRELDLSIESVSKLVWQAKDLINSNFIL